VGPRPAPPGPEPTTSPSTSTSQPSPRPSGPAPTAVTSGMFLAPDDLPGGPWTRPPEFEGLTGPDPWYWDQTDVCPAYHSADYPSLRQQLDLHVVGYTNGTAGFSELVAVYRPGWGTQQVNDVLHVVTRCGGQRPSPGQRPQRAGTVWWLVEAGFAGDESVMVREESYGYSGNTVDPSPFVTDLVVVVRVGDVVATVRMPHTVTLDRARALAATAADRLTRR
jgi:hypothetical protein